MNSTIINNWNSVVTSRDIIYHLGDFSFGEARKYLNELNGTIYFVRGNHEKPLIHEIGQANIPYIRHLKIDNYPEIVISHFAMRVWNKSHFGSWHLFGHSHGTLEGQGKSFDVGVDCNNFTPISIIDIERRMQSLPENFNHIKHLPGYSDAEFEKGRTSEEE